MTVRFTKMNGAGNDFILVDNRAGQVQLTPAQVVQLCDRHRGVGADGLLLWIPSRSGQADWAWDFYNSDGSFAEMCGNGARCFARFIQRHTGVERAITFETGAGIVAAEFQAERVAVTLTAPKNLRMNRTLTTTQGELTLSSIDTGVPHAVLFVPDADQAMVQPLGAEVRRHAEFSPRGTNVNFVQVLGPDSIRVRTYERGVEGETLACGTGVTASALVAARAHGFASPVKVRVQNGDTLEVSFQQSGDGFRDVRLTGPAEFVFEGTIEV